LLFAEKGFNSGSGPTPSMNSSPSGGEDLHMVQHDKPLPRPHGSATPDQTGTNAPVVSSVDDGGPRAGSGRLSFLASLLLIALAFSIGLSYYFEKRWDGRAAARSSNGAGKTTLVESSNTGAAGALGPDLFRVNSISLADRPVAVVNGQAVSEGDTFVVNTSSGPVTARVTKIEEGVVQILAGGERIDAKVSPATAPKAEP
jgi:hypothetical protein